MTLYFAYGSNMNRADMAQRCPGAFALGTAMLKGWRYLIMKDGYASIRREAGAAVRGVLWRVNAADLAALDDYEDIASGLYSRRQVSVRSQGRTYRALVYVGGSQLHGAPLQGYQEHVDGAAAEWRLPAAYRRELRRWRKRRGTE